jgi:hypothetical protein
MQRFFLNGWSTQLLGAPFNRALFAIEWGLQDGGITEDLPRSGNQGRVSIIFPGFRQTRPHLSQLRK